MTRSLGPTLAAVDIGSKAIRMVLGQLHPDGTLQITQRWRAFLSLGQAVFEHQEIPPQTAAELQKVLCSFQQALPPQTPWALSATSAFREARNRDAIQRKLAQVGFPIRILSGREEAQQLHQLIQKQWPTSGVALLHADLGGGSLELSLEEQGQLLWQESLPQGVVRRTLGTSADRWELLRGPLSQIRSPARQLILSGGSARQWGEKLQAAGVSEQQELGRHCFERMELPGATHHSYAEQVFAELIDLWQPQQVIVVRIGLKEALLLKLAEQVFPGSYRLRLEAESPVTQVESFPLSATENTEFLAGNG